MKTATLAHENQHPFLPPLEQPPSLLMRLVYRMSRKEYGKVLTPLKVHALRLPAGFGMFYGKVSKLDQQLELPTELIHLVREQVARINHCTFCLDIGRWYTRKAKLREAKFEALGSYQTSPLFTPAEIAALDYVTELTEKRQVDPETFARMARCFSERQVCEILWLVASEHLYNVTNLGMNVHSDGLCNG